MSYRRGPPDTAGMVSLKVDNLSYRTSSDDLRRAFEKYGDVGDVYIPRDRFTRESRGFAFVRFYDKRDAEDAMDNMDSSVFDGRELRVQTARYGRPDTRRGPPRRYGGGGFGGGRDRDRDWGGGRHSSRYRSRSRSRSRSHSRRSRSGSRKRSRRSSTRSRSESRSKSRSRSRSASRHRSYSKSKSKSPRKEDD